MSQPIEVAYAAACSALAAALVGAGFIPSAAALEIDPPAAFEPSGDETGIVTAAAAVKTKTEPVKTFMGGPSQRYVVEREFTLELAACGPESGSATRAAKLTAAVAACAALPESDPMLSGAAERFELTGVIDGDIPPNGLQSVLTFTVRVRSADRLGLSA